MPMERYRPELMPEVEAFAKRLKWFGYVKSIIRWHTEESHPGGCWVWLEDKEKGSRGRGFKGSRIGRMRSRGGRVVAFCGLVYLNRQDAWLYGMRVARDVQGKGIARRFTRGLLDVARAAGREWAGINTFDYPKPSPVYRIAERLGMKVVSVHATDAFWNLPDDIRGPRPRRTEDIFGHFTELGQRTIFHEHPGWLWSRLTPRRRRWVNRHGYRVGGVPLHIVHHGVIREPDGWHRSTTVNLFDRPGEFRDVLPSILMRGRGKHRAVALNYPAEWKRELRRAVRDIVPDLKRGKNCWTSAWRIYGKDLRQA